MTIYLNDGQTISFSNMLLRLYTEDSIFVREAELKRGQEGFECSEYLDAEREITEAAFLHSQAIIEYNNLSVKTKQSLAKACRVFWSYMPIRYKKRYNVEFLMRVYVDNKE